MEKFNCIPNPFDNNNNNNSFVLYDFDRNKINICPLNTTMDYKIYNICEKMCPKNCDQSYYSIIFEKIIRNNFHEGYSKDIILKFVNRPIKNYHYQAQIKVNLIECVTNIGGLLGLYIGLSIVDLSDIAKTMLTRMITMIEYITSILCLQVLRIRSKKIIKNILTYLHMMKKLPLKHIINAITTPILFMQLFYLIEEYLKYPTQSGIEFPLFETNASSSNRVRISGKEFPDISLCHTINIDDILFDTTLSDDVRKTLDMIDDIKIDQISYEEAIKKFDSFTSTHKYNCQNRSLFIHHDYYEVFELIFGLMKNKWTMITLNSELFLINNIYDNCFDDDKQNDYFAYTCKIMIKYITANSYDQFNIIMDPINNIEKYGLNATLDLFPFFNVFQHVSTRFNLLSVELMPNKLSLTPYGMCTTISPGQQLADKFIEQLAITTLIQSTIIKYTVFIHPFDTIPIRQLNAFNIDQDRYKMIILSKYTLEKLPAPYDTDCQPYTHNDNQHQCITKCYLKKYHDKFNCIPSKPMHLSVNLNQSQWKFCPKDYNEDIVMIENNINGESPT